MRTRTLLPGHVLAAVFAAGGENECEPKVQPCRHWGSLRGRFTIWSGRLSHRMIPPRRHGATNTASLKRLISDRRNRIGVLPDFHPGDHWPRQNSSFSAAFDVRASRRT